MALVGHIRRGVTGGGRRSAARGYHRLLVPLVDNAESERAIELACRLASDAGASIVALVVIEVPALLPLDAHMLEEEAAARGLLERAGATADSYGIGFAPKIVRGREASAEIVRIARDGHAELVLMGAARRSNASPAAPIFGPTVKHVLEFAPCRVLLAAANGSQAGTAAVRDAA
jgi:nucleotide-binding universal stress UspA family protein